MDDVALAGIPDDWGGFTDNFGLPRHSETVTRDYVIDYVSPVAADLMAYERGTMETAYTYGLDGRISQKASQGGAEENHAAAIAAEIGRLYIHRAWLGTPDYTTDAVAYFSRICCCVEYFPGFTWDRPGQLYAVDTHPYFLSKSFSKDFANEVMSMRDTDFWGGLSAADIAAESYAHAIMLMYSEPLKGFWDRAESWNESAIAIDIAANDPRASRFNAIWNLVGPRTGNPLANMKIFK